MNLFKIRPMHSNFMFYNTRYLGQDYILTEDKICTEQDVPFRLHGTHGKKGDELFEVEALEHHIGVLVGDGKTQGQFLIRIGQKKVFTHDEVCGRACVIVGAKPKEDEEDGT